MTNMRALLPLPPGLTLDSVDLATTLVTFEIVATSQTASCPLCATPSTQMHSHYQRTVADLPCCGRRVVLHLHVRRFRCSRPSCPRRIFTERLPLLVRPWAQMTERLCKALVALGVATSGQQGARLAAHLGMRVCASTMNRLILALPPPAPLSSRVVGIDEWSYRRGHRYGTILVDLEARCVVDLLPERQAQDVAQWIQQHPQVQRISRDRGGIYAEGVRQANAAIVQIADRWHLLKNLGEALERFVERCQLSQLLVHLLQNETTSAGPSPPPHPETPMPGSASKQQQRFRAIHDLVAAGSSLHTISRTLGLARNTVRRYARMSVVPSRPRLRASQVDPYRAYLYRRWSEGCTSGVQLLAEIQQRGYRGGYTQLKGALARLRQQVPAPHLPPVRLSPRQIRWLLARSPDRLTEDEHHHRTALLAASPETYRIWASYHAFWRLLRGRQVNALEGWLWQAEHSGIEELQAFAAGVRRDHTAVTQAIGSRWSQGQVEGQITRLKLIKRQMYGRAGFRLLRQRVLHRI